ncbi:hypothetical protein E1A91_D05G157300v1 [Gossypium mustelinum]|uniref:Uncharacterized protein n=1 Tax=Gossypium mustelinum TaxID=34275 RepID=A0A5D2UVL6_GOSMU|nr:hypothetical protein E1A91_D05G157300v1 [Gossypium mustelinum]
MDIWLVFITPNKLKEQPKSLLSPSFLAKPIDQSSMYIHIRLPSFPNHFFQFSKGLLYTTLLTQPINQTRIVNQIRLKSHLHHLIKVPERSICKTLVTEQTDNQCASSIINNEPSFQHFLQPLINL